MTVDAYSEIAKRAYAIWEVEGQSTGREIEHWLRAEAELQVKDAGSVTGAPRASAKPRRPARRRARRTE